MTCQRVGARLPLSSGSHAERSSPESPLVEAIAGAGARRGLHAGCRHRRDRRGVRGRRQGPDPAAADSRSPPRRGDVAARARHADDDRRGFLRHLPGWQRDARGFQQLAAIGSTNWSLLLQEGEPATIPIAAVSASFFPLAGARAAIGRTIQPQDDGPAGLESPFSSFGSWQRRFGGDPAVVGRQLRFQATVAYTVVGVMPEGFGYPRGAELWVPVVPQLQAASAQWGDRRPQRPGFGVLFVLGRLIRASPSSRLARGSRT